jgi:predicted PurR-regulated permease PerM
MRGDPVSEQPPPQPIALASVSTRTAVRLVLVVLLTTLAVLVALWLLYRLQTVVVWGILALFLTVALNPAVDWLAGRRVPRAVAILLAYAGVLVVVAGLAALVAPPLLQQGSALVHALQQPGGLTAEAQRIAAPLGLGGFVAGLRPELDAIPGQVAGQLGSVITVTANTVGTVTAGLSILVLAFFFLHDGAGLVEASVGLLPDARRPRARRVLEQSSDAIAGYIRGNLAISVIAGLSALAGMLVLGVPYALPLAVLLAVIDLIPMVGVTVGAIPVVLAALSVSPLKAVVMLAYIIVYQQIESNVLNPLIYGRSDQLPALTVFLAFLVGSLLWGILGALIAIPAANIIRILVREWQAARSDGIVVPAGAPAADGTDARASPEPDTAPEAF